MWRYRWAREERSLGREVRGSKLLAHCIFGAVCFLSACGASPQGEEKRSPQAHLIVAAADLSPGALRDLTPVHWRVAALRGPREVEIFSSAGYCDGEAPPRYEAVRVWERKTRIYIAPFIAKAHPAGGFCRGIGAFQRGTVRIAQDVDDARLYDATKSPPRLRWPEP